MWQDWPQHLAHRTCSVMVATLATGGCRCLTSWGLSVLHPSASALCAATMCWAQCDERDVFSALRTLVLSQGNQVTDKETDTCLIANCN